MGESKKTNATGENERYGLSDSCELYYFAHVAIYIRDSAFAGEF